MLNFSTNILQPYGRYSEPLRDWVEFNPCARKEHLHGRTLGMNDNLKGDLLFENEIRNAY